MFRYGIPLVATLLHVYVAWRASSVPALSRRLPRRWIFGVAGLLWASCIAGRLVGHGSSGPIARGLELFGMCALASVGLMAVALLAAELATGFGLLLRRWAPGLRGWALLVGLVLSGVALVQGLRAPVVRRYEVRFPGLPASLDGTVVVVASDLHLGNLLGAGWLADRVEQIRGSRPDLVLFLGDIFEGHGPVAPELIAELRRLSAPLGLFAVTGNHEHHGEGQEDKLEAAGFRVLHDGHAVVRPGLVLVGVDDLTRRRRSGADTGAIVTRVLRRAPPGASVFLSHAPINAEEAAAAGADLMLSGHTHGGQIWPLGYLVRLAYPLIGGRYLVNGLAVIVCRGTGTWGPRMRLWRPGEILRLVLRASGS